MSEDFINELISSKKAFLNPMLITSFLLKLFSNGLEISISFMLNAFALTFVVEKKEINKANVRKKNIYIFKIVHINFIHNINE